MYRLIPKMDDLLNNEDIKALEMEYPVGLVRDFINMELQNIRSSIKDGENKEFILAKIENIPNEVRNNLANYLKPQLKRVVNATGTVIHTNLGRSLINEEMAEEMVDILVHYSNLEYDLEKGVRGSRYQHIEELIKDITGAEAALVVNNNAAAVLLVLSTFAEGGEAIISRGELIEIGGSFRIPDVMEYSGCTLHEVGTTNKTHLKDYENAINENTKVMLKVHTSNYKVVGFTDAVSNTELKELSVKTGVPLIEDLGSGVLVDLEDYGLDHEPTVQESIRSGIDIVTFSGDKLLGGPQAGIIIGKKEMIDKLKKNQLTRALRVDKMTLKLLEEVLKVYFDKNSVADKIPTLNMITKKSEDIKNHAQELKEKIDNLNLNFTCEIVKDYSEVGGGSLPTEKLETYVLEINSKEFSEDKIDKFMHECELPVVGRISDKKYIIDPRTLLSGDDDIIINNLRKLGEKI
ncbi:MAG: L-seryl-tRNA(Sec) selenium transferase [Firmicutes bacterium]|nr:L-seryl-tRNA(Sec) selenium transferase [Bacillota bacterium]